MQNYHNENNEQLRIDQISMRGLVVEVDEDSEPEAFEDRHLHNTQILKYFDKVRELLPDEEFSDAPYLYRFYVTLGIRSLFEEDANHPDQESVSPMLLIQADYVVQYISQVRMTEDDCLALADQDVYLHVWPYFREVVQSSCGRLGITCLNVPVYQG